MKGLGIVVEGCTLHSLLESETNQASRENLVQEKGDPAPQGCGHPTPTPCSVASTCGAPTTSLSRGGRLEPRSPVTPRPPPRGPRARLPRTYPRGWSGAGRGKSARSSDPLGAPTGGAALAQWLRSARSLSRERGGPGSGQVRLKGRRGPGLGRGAGKGPDTLAHTVGKPTAANDALEGGCIERGRVRRKEGDEEGGRGERRELRREGGREREASRTGAWRETVGVREAGSSEGKPRANAACEWLQDEYAQGCL